MGNRSTNTNTGDNIRVDGHLVSFFNSNFKTRLVGTNRGSTTPVVATGGTKTTPGNGYIYHVFCTAGPGPATGQTFVKTAGVGAAVEILLVGGGGGGGGGTEAGGGGGAGGVAYGTGIELDNGTYPLEIGAGGAKGPFSADSSDGGNSSFNAGAVMPGEFGTFTAYGGGGGGCQNTPAAADVQSGRPGGSGGGSSGTDTTNGNGGTATMPTSSPVNPATYWLVYGNNGGATTSTSGDMGSGGGGAGAVGGSISSGPQVGGLGGAGIAIPAFPGPIMSPHPLINADTAAAIGPTGVYGQGGGGASNVPSGTSPSPTNGGGRGATPQNDSTAGNDNGGGGGGGGQGVGGYQAKGGGFGLVAVRYKEVES